MRKPQLIAGLELGDRQFTMAVGHLMDQRRLLIRALDSIPAKGIERGGLTDPIECSDAVARLFRQVEKGLSARIPKVLTAMHGSHVKSYNASASIPIPDPSVGIGPRDVDRVVNTCRTLSLEYDRQILHAFERGFAVDGQSGIKDPVALSGNKLGVDLHLITAQSLALQNFVKVISRAGLEVDQFVLPGLASAEAVLSELDKDLGVTLIRIGDVQTEALIFIEGAVRETFLIPWGTDHMAESLSRTLKFPRVTVEQLIEQIKSIEDRPEWASVPLRAQAGSLSRTLPKGQMTQMVGSKAKEFLTRIQRRLDESPYFRESAAGVVMVGEMTHLDGFLEASENILNMPVRLGTIREVEVTPPMELNPSHTTVVGLLCFGARRQSFAAHAAPTSLVQRWMEKTRQVFEEYF